MKQFIVLAAILPILLVLIAQFTLEARRGLRMGAAENAVRAFCMEASYYGGGGAAQAEALRTELARIFRADARDVTVELSERDGAHIDWRVSFPVGEIMAGAGFMGLSQAENSGRAQMGGVIVIAREPEPPGDEGEPGDGGGSGSAGGPDDPGNSGDNSNTNESGGG
ncbi:MAG: hypothetical protein LBS91_05440 [Clostridiales Family XIII bacterium]|jgi:hypothetical protein|nr:hypothetical protein [Clostridiales Family XIII bacterium]